MATVMIVDDDRSTVTLLKTLLELDGFEVVISPRGSTVLEKARAEHPDLFMIDYNLSDMIGTAVVETLRADPQFATTPIIIASGMNVETEAKKAGATLFLVKPLEPGDLATTFNKLLDAR